MSPLPPLKRHYRPVYAVAAIGVLVTLVVLFILQGSPIFTRAEYSAYDFQFQRRGQIPVPSNLVIVGVDSPSVDDLANGDYANLPRRYFAQAVNFLHRAGARAIGIDWTFLRAGNARDNAALAIALRRAHNVVLAEYLDSVSATNNLSSFTSLRVPIPVLAHAARALALANFPKDSDSTVRALDVTQLGPGGTSSGGKSYPSFAAQVAAVALNQPVAEVIRGLPQHMQVNFVGPQNPGNAGEQSIATHQFESVALGDDAPALYKNKIVLIIPAATGFKDILPTPYGDMFGGALQANALATILNRNPITPIGDMGNNLTIIIIGLLTSLAASRFGIWRSAAAVIFLAVVYVGLTMELFSLANISINLVTPETTIVLAFAGIMAFRFATEERKRRKTSKIFGQYVKPEIVDILVNAADEEAALAGARRPITVLFVDVRGFTAMSERMEPEKVVEALDIYLEELTESVQVYDGTIDKYVGDELMALWNAPRFQDDHALLAVQSALDMVNRMESINNQLVKKGLPAIRYGIGVNSGEAVVGQMGSSFRKQYDVIGDTVNTGARLCSAAGGGEIIIGQTTWEMLGDRLVVEETEKLRLKGKSSDFRTFRVIAIRPEPAIHAQPIAAPV